MNVLYLLKNWTSWLVSANIYTFQNMKYQQATHGTRPAWLDCICMLQQVDLHQKRVLSLEERKKLENQPQKNLRSYPRYIQPQKRWGEVTWHLYRVIFSHLLCEDIRSKKCLQTWDTIKDMDIKDREMSRKADRTLGDES